GKVGILHFEEASDAIRITLAQRGKADKGQLTLEFSDRPLLLRNMIVTDSAGQVTTVSLNHARFGVPLDSELFVFREPGERQRIH
ncbi:MAG: outer-membrane lipoprotein carrier protein LolA, partial [Pseudomonadota bacterium]|nr:outer-membrane lipoprotein carrier protein LolA [Pseudomonadota bacterium]